MKTIYLNEKKRLTKRRVRKIIKKLEKTSKKEDIVVATSKELGKNEELVEEILKRKIDILTGRWLPKFMMNEILEETVKLENKELKTINFVILIDNIEDIALQQIIEIAKKVKSLKIVTKNISSFSYLEEELYLKYGIAMQITNNRIKALLNADIIINFDFDESRINEYKIPELATIINIKHIVNIANEKFRGNIISDYDIEYNQELIEEFGGNEDFDNIILYESLIYRKDTYSHIKSQIKKDNVRIILNRLTKT